MKKSLIAVAALAVVSAASAQSSVSLYGVADMWVGKAKGGKVTVGDGGITNSRFGLKGSEDLGGGLKANFTLENEVNLVNGAAPANAFQRNAWVGLSGGFGSLKLGRSTTAFDDVNGASVSGFDSALSAYAPVWLGYTPRSSAQIYYATPAFNGISGAVGFNLAGNKATNDIMSAHVKYEGGPVFAAFGYQNDKTANAKHTVVNGSYDLGMAKVKGSVRNVKGSLSTVVVNPNLKANEYELGVDVPMGDRLTLSAGYAKSTTELGALSVRNSVGYGLAAGYSLSKRTTAYGGFRADKTNNVKGNFWAAGVNHTF